MLSTFVFIAFWTSSNLRFSFLALALRCVTSSTTGLATGFDCYFLGAELKNPPFNIGPDLAGAGFEVLVSSWLLSAGSLLSDGIILVTPSFLTYSGFLPPPSLISSTYSSITFVCWVTLCFLIFST